MLFSASVLKARSPCLVEDLNGLTTEAAFGLFGVALHEEHHLGLVDQSLQPKTAVAMVTES